MTQSVVIYTTLPVVGGNSTISLELVRNLRRTNLAVMLVVKPESNGGYCEKTAEAIRSTGARIRVLNPGGKVSENLKTLWALGCAAADGPSVFVTLGMR